MKSKIGASFAVNFINGNHYFVAVGKDGANARAYEFHQAYGAPAP